jgi:membrane fusion protein (multidrug efflux system)
MSTPVKVYGFLGLLVLLAGGGYFIKQQFFNGDVAQANADGETKAAKKDGADEAVPVELVKAEEGAISAFVSSTANLKARRDVELAARTEGVAREVLVEEGDLVREGQVLCRLDDRSVKIRHELTDQKLAQARLQHDKARIRHEKAATQISNTETEVKRSEKAFAEGLVSEKEVDDLRYQLAELQHDQQVAESEQKEFAHRVEELEAELAQVKYDLSQTEVVAPFAGYITERKVELGQTVRNLDPLFRLGAFSPLEADVHLSERDARRVRPGQTANVSLGAGSEEAKGEVLRISPVVDNSTGTVKVTLTVQPPSRLFKPGAFVRVDIETDSREKTTLIPKRALVQQDGLTYVFVADGEQAQRREVKLGYESAGAVEILDGVTQGENVVVAGQGNLKEGAKIKEVQGGAA